MADEPNLELPSFLRRKGRPEDAPEGATADATGDASGDAPDDAEATEPGESTSEVEPASAEAEPVGPETSDAEPAEPVPVEDQPTEESPRPAEPEPPEETPAVPEKDRPLLDPVSGEAEESKPATAAADTDPPRRKRLPRLSRVPAALVAGLVAGLVGVGLVAVAGAGCDWVIGTASCGGGAGLLLWLLTGAAMVLVGAALLRVWDVAEPTGSSLLGVGLVGVLGLLFLVSSAGEWWLLLVVPALAAAAFLLAVWLTRQFVEVRDDSHR